jgi:hypothetical protein
MRHGHHHGRSRAERRRQARPTPTGDGCVRPNRKPVILPGQGVSLLSRHANRRRTQPEHAQHAGGSLTSILQRGVISILLLQSRVAYRRFWKITVGVPI